jgi:hypothetical protein
MRVKRPLLDGNGALGLIRFGGQFCYDICVC